VPTIRLTAHALIAPRPVVLPSGRTIDVSSDQFRCLIRLPNQILPYDAVIDTGAPLVYFPQLVWSRLRDGIDFEWLTPVAGASPPAQIGRWQFTFQMARFLAPLWLMDYSTEVERPEVIAAFASSNPPAPPTRQALPPIVIGLWGGLLEGGRIGVARDPATGRVAGDIAFP
jgi:hypothetical protein